MELSHECTLSPVEETTHNDDEMLSEEEDNMSFNQVMEKSETIVASADHASSSTELCDVTAR